MVVGEGIDGLLGLIVRLIVEPGTPVVTSLGAYPTFNFHVAGFGGRLVTVPYRDDREDLDALLDAVRRENAALVYLSNPDNPMGTWHSAEAVTEFAQALPETAMLVLDEAYGETAPASALPAIAALADLPNVLRFRTFSKAYGLAGQRVGYVFGVEETVSMFHRVRNHFGVNRLGQAAALAALTDQNWLASRHCPGLQPRATGSLTSPAPTAWRRLPRPPISSPWIAAATAPAPRPFLTAWSAAVCSSACPASPRSTAASGSRQPPERHLVICSS